MTNNRLIELLTRKLSGEATSDDLMEIDLLISADPEVSERIRKIEKFWSENDTTGPHFIDEAFEKLKLRLDAKEEDQSRAAENTHGPEKPDITGIINIAAMIMRLFYKKIALIPVN
ncbi:MAG: hypothetical protein EOO02_04030 [Chitinophagaceae bacterium]|nr:MAG: hypothetical protein EOO02_04030 [Chitinophagaceae bacterium]